MSSLRKEARHLCFFRCSENKYVHLHAYIRRSTPPSSTRRQTNVNGSSAPTLDRGWPSHSPRLKFCSLCQRKRTSLRSSPGEAIGCRLLVQATAKHAFPRNITPLQHGSPLTDVQRLEHKFNFYTCMYGWRYIPSTWHSHRAVMSTPDAAKSGEKRRAQNVSSPSGKPELTLLTPSQSKPIPTNRLQKHRIIRRY